MSKYDALEARAARLSATGTAFVYDCAEWGTPSYMAMSAYDFHRSFGFGQGVKIEVGSLAIAQRLVLILNREGTPSPIIAAHQAANRMAFVRNSILMRNRIDGKAKAAALASKRAFRALRGLTDITERAAAYDRGTRLYRSSLSYAQTAKERDAQAKNQLARIDLNSAACQADAARRERMRALVARFRTKSTGIPVAGCTTSK